MTEQEEIDFLKEKVLLLEKIKMLQEHLNLLQSQRYYYPPTFDHPMRGPDINYRWVSTGGSLGCGYIEVKD